MPDSMSKRDRFLRSTRTIEFLLFIFSGALLFLLVALVIPYLDSIGAFFAGVAVMLVLDVLILPLMPRAMEKVERREVDGA